MIEKSIASKINIPHTMLFFNLTVTCGRVNLLSEINGQGIPLILELDSLLLFYYTFPVGLTGFFCHITIKDKTSSVYRV